MTHFMMDDTDSIAATVFAGLVPAHAVDTPDRARRIAQQRSRMNRSVMNTVPVLLVGSLAAATFNLTGPVEPVNAKTPDDPRLSTERATKPSRVTTPTISEASTTIIGPAPASYRVAEGDTVSDIASRYGLSTASVLALNGLSWSSMIFPGQELKLTKDVVNTVPSVNHVKTTNGQYTIVAGDTISGISHKFGVSTTSVMSANGLGWSSIIYPGQLLIIPGNLSSPSQETEEYDFTADEDDAPSDSASSAESEDAAADVVEAPTEVVVEAPAPVVEPEPAPVAETAPAPVEGSTYLVVSGDTVSSIASRVGISTQALLDANGLTSSTVIYIGDTLTIPSSSSVPASTGGSVTYLNSEMRANAQVIIQVGRDLGVSDYGITIALATAMQESSLRNLTWGDRDSVGLFQQRPSSGWGTVSQLTTPSYAAKLFYGGPSNPNKGITRGLLEISGWQNMSVTKAAQAVQISAHPDAYAKWETSARSWLEQLG
ncbi:LysM peptidoglycan-binding domain-containing protein [Salinibacterium sp. SWN248]|uniref:LysM peptidoglycan-binding domain-containing protein n=1 Tax=Salinibacterium sp. SWN248 TaxID=2792056 RepID=UPI0018CF90A4|nr:LysM peptidoglycan-binding domain-containing protein [Salinibacterium sp. SWN248]MBH0024297.1 LysM peptidoglycan-binding domain-containing protein [Salinibacterium sp. SWN248]